LRVLRSRGSALSRRARSLADDDYKRELLRERSRMRSSATERLADLQVDPRDASSSTTTA
jgi:hypothetical protein